MESGNRNLLQHKRVLARPRTAEARQSVNCTNLVIRRVMLTLLTCALALPGAAAVVTIADASAVFFQVAIEVARICFVALYVCGL